MGSITAVNISERKGVVKHPIEKGYFKVNYGLEGDAHAGNLHRQVSLFGQESIDKMKASGVNRLCSKKFAENLTTDGVVLYELPLGTKMKIGQVILEVSKVGKECHQHEGCEITKSDGECVMLRECVFAKVLENGYIKTGDEIEVL